MEAERLVNTAEQNKLEEISLRPLRKVESLSIDPVDGKVKLDAKSIEMLDTLRKRFPLFMPEKKKRLILDKISMHGASVCRERGDTNVSTDDILVGVYQAVSPELIELVCSRLKISPEKRSGYKQKAFDMDYVSIDTFLSLFSALFQSNREQKPSI